MKIIVNSLDLNDAISKVSKALPVRDVAPILECIKVVAENDKLTLFATDKDLAIEKTIDANVIVGGATLVPGRVFGDYVRNIADSGDVSLELNDENRLVISTSSSECNISTLDVDDYPEAEQINDDSYFAIQEINLKDIINNVIFSVATDESRPMLKGVYFEAKDYTLTAVATDGYRFAMSKKALEEKTEEITATVPARSLSELAKLLEGSETVLKVYIEKNYLLVVLNNTKVLTRLLVSGQYIRYDNIIPKEFVATLLVNKENFEKALTTASIMSRGDKNNLVVLDIEEYTMNISSTSQYGSARENVNISLNGKDVRCAYNAKYINDCLKVINAEAIKMEFAQHSSCVITINNSDEVLYFILPVKQIV